MATPEGVPPEKGLSTLAVVVYGAAQLDLGRGSVRSSRLFRETRDLDGASVADGAFRLASVSCEEAV